MDLFLQLESNQLHDLREIFDDHDGLSIEQFVWAMLELLPGGATHGRPVQELVFQLSDLFQQVDINGDGTMEWDEFTHFFISSGMTKNEFRPRLTYQYEEREDFQHHIEHKLCVKQAKYIPVLQKVVRGLQGREPACRSHSRSCTRGAAHAHLATTGGNRARHPAHASVQCSCS